jgi:hypothetical protein
MKTRFKLTVCLVLLALLGSCGAPNKKVNYRDQLINAIIQGNQSSAELLLPKLNLSVNNRNLILQYFDMLSGKSLPLIQSLMVTNPMTINETQPVFLKIHRALNMWVFLSEIYRIEVSKDIRILQREQLYLAPSEVDFSKCQTAVNENCAQNSRTQLYHFMNQEQIIEKLQNMAMRDPCINLTMSLEGEDKANACLKKRMGELKVELLDKPEFSYQDWNNLLR